MLVVVVVVDYVYDRWVSRHTSLWNLILISGRSAVGRRAASA